MVDKLNESSDSPTTSQIPQNWDLTLLTKVLKVLLWVGVGLLVFGAWSGWLELQLLSDAKRGMEVSADRAEASDVRQGLIAIVQVLLFILTSVFFLRWTYGACHNARNIASSKMNFTPGWSVGWYFIPIANFYKPYKAVEEIYRVSENPGVDLKQRGNTPLVGGWWALWIISSVIGQKALRASLSAETPEELYNVSLWTFASDIIDIPLYLVLIVLIGKVFEMQTRNTRVGIG